MLKRIGLALTDLFKKERMITVTDVTQHPYLFVPYPRASGFRILCTVTPEYLNEGIWPQSPFENHPYAEEIDNEQTVHLFFKGSIL